MAEYKLNLSQEGIWQNELASGHSAINIISVKLHVSGFSAECVKRAADQVISSADIFRAKLQGNDHSICFALLDEPASFAHIIEEMTQTELSEHTGTGDKSPLGSDELYRAEVIPVKTGGILLYVRFHHLILDGYGMSLFSQRVLDTLEGKPPVPSSFFSKIDPGSAVAGDRDFWTESLKDADFQPELFQEEAAGPEKSEWEYTPDTKLCSRLGTLAESIGVTMPYVYLAAYAVYLARASAKPEAVILIPRLNRTAAERDTLGCFTLLVPVRIGIDGTDSFAKLCQKAKTAAQSASLHKNYGFNQILKLCREVNLSQQSLSEYVFNYYRYQIQSAVPFTLTLSVAGAMHNHLTWNVFTFERITRFSLDMRDGVYDKNRARYFIEGILGILEQGLTDKTIQEFTIVGAEEHRKLLSVCGKKTILNPQDTIVSVFERAVRLYGGRPALYAGSESLTFDELNRLSGVIAGNLITRGVKCGDIVAFLLNRDIRLIPVMIGILKAGAAFVPIDPSYPRERIASIFSDSGAKYLISSTGAAGRPEEFLDVDLLLQNDGSEIQPELPEISGEHLAYLIYTSGTTGKPKGVMLAHRGIVNIVQPENNPFNLEITSGCHGITAVGSISFDISLFEIFVPLMNGMFVELAPEYALTDPKELAGRITAHGADILHCTPSRLASYLKLPAFAGAFQKIRAVLSAGEVLHSHFAEELKTVYGVKIFNGYGPTETTIGATITEAGDNRTIGRPIGNTGILILGNGNTLLPWGAVGEICIYGAGMGLGYKNLPDQTREKFCSFEEIPIYRTGDLGHIAPDGRLIYHGRNDRLVKLRGLRIELPEIEGAMAAFQGISAAVCIVRRLGRSEHLAGFYTVQDNGPADEHKLKTYLQGRLPVYMVPDVLVHLEEMPQTSAGKTDMKALEAYPVVFEQVYTAPGNDAERFICEKMELVLNCGRTGITDNFFDLGGDSLSAVMLMIELEEKFGAGSVDVAAIYQCPTPLLLAGKLTQKGGREANPLEDLSYSGIDQLLKAQKVSERQPASLGNVLITGVTGYLGAHILINLLMRHDLCGHIYCLARGKGRLTAEQRVKSTLFYYGESDFADSCGIKWEVIEGNITNPGIFAGPFDQKLDTVINSAANVAHFSQGDELRDTNTGGVKNLISLCLSHHARLCQVSTISVGGAFPSGQTPVKLTERDLFIGQEILNSYIMSKFMAEYEVLQAAAEHGLQAVLLRVGNLQGRIHDGEFQMNLKTNAFTRQMASYVRMGAVPQSLYEASVNFSPVDEVAHRIVTLLARTRGQLIFHIYPAKEVPYRRMFETLGRLGIPVRIMADPEFDSYVQTLKQTDDGKKMVEGILIERPDLNYRMTETDNRITQEAITMCQEPWTSITDDYLDSYFSILNDMGMF